LFKGTYIATDDGELTITVTEVSFDNGVTWLTKEQALLILSLLDMDEAELDEYFFTATGSYSVDEESGDLSISFDNILGGGLTFTKGDAEKDGESVQPSLPGTITIAPTTATVGTKLTATYSGEEDVSFLWYKDNSAITSETDEEYTPTTVGSYKVLVYADGFVPKFSDAVNVTLKILTGTIAITPVTATVNTELTATYSGGSETVTYQWKKGGVSISTGGTGTSYTPLSSGTYSVTVSLTDYESKNSNNVVVKAADIVVSFAASGEGKTQAKPGNNGTISYSDGNYTYEYGTADNSGNGNGIVRFCVDLSETKLSEYEKVTFTWKAVSGAPTDYKNLYLLASGTEAGITPWKDDATIKAAIVSTPPPDEGWGNHLVGGPQVNGTDPISINLPIVTTNDTFLNLTGNVWFSVFLLAPSGSYTISDLTFVAKK